MTKIQRHNNKNVRYFLWCRLWDHVSVTKNLIELKPSRKISNPSHEILELDYVGRTQSHNKGKIISKHCSYFFVLFIVFWESSSSHQGVRIYYSLMKKRLGQSKLSLIFESKGQFSYLTLIFIKFTKPFVRIDNINLIPALSFIPLNNVYTNLKSEFPSTVRLSTKGTNNFSCFDISSMLMYVCNFWRLIS